MKVRVYPADTTGSGNCRINYPAQAAQAAGVEVEWGSTGQTGEGMPIERIRHNGKSYVRPKPLPDDIDVLVFQRAADETTVAILPSLQAAGYAVVVDIDDDLSCLPPTHPACRRLNPRLSPSMNWRWLEQACRIADLVTVSTPSLARRYGRHGRVMVLENCVPERLLDLPHQGDGRTVGWAGGTIVHPGDLAATRGGVADAIRKTPNARFLQVGPAMGVRQQLGLDEEPEATGGMPDVNDYYRAVTRLDVGICPLADTVFNAGKSWLKATEMTALGVAAVMSPRAEYKRLHADGIGLLAENPRDWRRAIQYLLGNPNARAELVGQGRDAIRERHMYERNGGRWVNAWEIARENFESRHRRRVAA